MTVSVLRTRLTTGVELPGELLEHVEAYAGLHGILPSEALRYLVEAGLAAEAHAQCVQAQAPEPDFWGQNWAALTPAASGRLARLR